MRIVQQCVFDDEDRRLLSIELPDNPCDNCHLSKIGGCCGCDDNTKYYKITNTISQMKRERNNDNI